MRKRLAILAIAVVGIVGSVAGPAFGAAGPPSGSGCMHGLGIHC